MDTKFRKLIELGAGKFEHIDSVLITHLESIRCLLKEWNASLDLQQAGLYYPAYTEVELSGNLKCEEFRSNLRRILGEEVENIIYYFCAWDKTASFAQDPKPAEFKFHNQITGKQELLPFPFFCQLCELYAAIEIEMVSSPNYCSSKNSEKLSGSLLCLMPFLSAPAKRKIQFTLGSKATQTVP
ncbi:DUF6817 domain-containing protein [Paraglaciecola sp. 2405UD69-4]|uniref:DUF6817 domain-containing protein n=1 Tax=Paraglaciecola sp. 2405UD69-4 TaxID=3391836 RepID=UPI0039C8C2F8